MIEVKNLADGEMYRGKTVETIARRLYGKNVGVRLESSPAFNPPYRSYLVTRTDRYGTHVITTLIVYADATSSSAKPSKTKCGRALESIYPGNDVERIALDLVEYAYDYDTYEFKDNYDSMQEAFSDAVSSLSNRNGVMNTLSWFDDEDVSGDPVRRKRRDRIVKDLRGLAGGYASPKSGKQDKRNSGKGRKRCRDARVRTGCV